MLNNPVMLVDAGKPLLLYSISIKRVEHYNLSGKADRTVEKLKLRQF